MLCVAQEIVYCSSYRFCSQIRVVREQAPRDGKEKTAIIQSKTAGLSAIQLQLNSSARAVREVAAGSAFYDTLPREEKRKVSMSFRS